MGRSRATKPTRKQKILMQSANLVPKNWLVLKETETGLLVVNRGSGNARTVKKYQTQGKTKSRSEENRS